MNQIRQRRTKKELWCFIQANADDKSWKSYRWSNNRVPLKCIQQSIWTWHQYCVCFYTGFHAIVNYYILCIAKLTPIHVPCILNFFFHHQDVFSCSSVIKWVIGGTRKKRQKLIMLAQLSRRSHRFFLSLMIFNHELKLFLPLTYWFNSLIHCVN